MSDGNGSGKTEARELGIIIGKLDGIHRSQSRVEAEVQEIRATVTAMSTEMAVMREKQTEERRDLEALEARVDGHSRDLQKFRGSWKMAIVKYGASTGAGAGLLAGLLKVFRVKLGGD